MPEQLSDYFGIRLAAIREALDLKQSEIGEKLGCSNGAYSLYERNKRQPALSVLLSLCSEFGVSIDYLLGCLSPSPDIFSDRLREVLDHRKEKALSDFVADSGLDAASAKLLLSGRCFPNAKVLKNLSRYFNCSSDFLVGLSDTMEQNAGVPIHIPASFVPRDPLDVLDPDLRSKAEGYLDSLFEQQKERLKQAKAQEA